MECAEFRELIGTDPAAVNPGAEQHLESCPACKANAERLGASERLINEALRFEVRALQRHLQQQRQPQRTSRFRVFAGTAAAMVAVVAVWLLVQPVGNGGALAVDVAEHWHHEPHSWVVSDVSVSSAKLQGVLKNAAQIDLGALGPVTYAASCFFRGHWVPHLVVQGQAGPVMVLLLPNETVDEIQAVAIQEQGLAGVIVPHGAGSVAILGTVAEPMAPLSHSLVNAVQWSI